MNNDNNLMKVHEQHKSKGPKSVNFALIVISTSRYQEKVRGEITSDKTIPLVQEILDGNMSFSLYISDIVSDSESQIESILKKLLDEDNLHAIIFSGGTGLSRKDITYETVEPLLEKKIEGFGEIFRYLSYKEIGTSAMLSRALAGKIKDKIIFLLPGSPNAVKLALKKIIIPEIKHLIYIINKIE